MTKSMPISARRVTVGQEITDRDTPDGPWYSVVKATRRSLVVAAYGMDVRIPINGNDIVLARS
jgi:hypothetical protein